MVGPVAFHNRAFVARAIAAVLWRESPQPYRREQMVLHDPENLPGLLFGHQVVVEDDRVDLIGTNRCIVPFGSVDHVVETSACFVPELRAEGRHGLLPIFSTTHRISRLAELSGETLSDFQRPRPQRLNLDRISMTWRDNPVIDFSMHPRELHAWYTSGDETVFFH